MMISDRGLKPITELAAGRPHGDRLRYLAGCRCAECRRANASYESMRERARRNGDWNGIISAAKARAHIKKLSRQGVGRAAVAAASDVGKTTIACIRTKKKLHIRARTERRILAVTKAMAMDRALIPAKRSWYLIALLLKEDYTKTSLAQRLGYKHALQFGKERLTVRNAYRIERLYRRLTT